MVDREYIVARCASAPKPTDYTSDVQLCTSLIIATFCLVLVVRSYPGVQQSVSSRKQTSYTNNWVEFYWEPELNRQFILVMKFTFRSHKSTFGSCFLKGTCSKHFWLSFLKQNRRNKVDYEAGTYLYIWGIISRLRCRGTPCHYIPVRGSTIPN